MAGDQSNISSDTHPSTPSTIPQPSETTPETLNTTPSSEASKSNNEQSTEFNVSVSIQDSTHPASPEPTATHGGRISEVTDDGEELDDDDEDPNWETGSNTDNTDDDDDNNSEDEDADHGDHDYWCHQCQVRFGLSSGAEGWFQDGVKRV